MLPLSLVGHGAPLFDATGRSICTVAAVVGVTPPKCPSLVTTHNNLDRDCPSVYRVGLLCADARGLHFCCRGGGGDGGGGGCLCCCCGLIQSTTQASCNVLCDQAGSPPLAGVIVVLHTWLE